MAFKNVDHHVGNYEMECGFSEVWSTLVKFPLCLLEQSPETGPTKDASRIAN